MSATEIPSLRYGALKCYLWDFLHGENRNNFYISITGVSTADIDFEEHLTFSNLLATDNCYFEVEIKQAKEIKENGADSG